MSKKLGIVYNLRKLCGFSVIALLTVVPSLASASQRLTSQEYVDSKIHGTGTLSSSSTTTAPSEQMVYNAIAAINVMSGADGTNSGTSGLVPAPVATDNTKFLRGDGTWADVDALPSGQAGQILQYTNSAWTSTSMDTTPTSGHTVPVTSGGVYDAVNGKQTKPASGVANGKVLTYTGSDADTQVSAAYVTLPVATGAPSANTPTSFAEVWIQ